MRGRRRPRTTWSHVVKRDMRGRDMKGMMHRSVRSGGNCCGKPLAISCVSGENGRKTIVLLLLLVGLTIHIAYSKHILRINVCERTALTVLKSIFHRREDCRPVLKT